MTLVSPYPFWTGRRALSVLYFYSGVAIALLLMANVALLSHLRDRALGDASAALSNAGAEVAEQTDRSLQSLAVALAKVDVRLVGGASSGAVEPAMSTQAVHLMLDQQITALPEIDALAIVDRHGSIVGSTGDWSDPTVGSAGAGDLDGFLRARPGSRFFITAPVRSAAGGWSVRMAHRPDQGDRGFALVGTMRLRADGGAKRAGAGRGGAAISWQRMDLAPIARYSNSPGMTATHGTTGVLREVDGRDGRQWIKAFSALANWPLVILAARPEAEALADWRRVSGVLWSFTIAISLSIATVAFSLRQKAVAGQSTAVPEHDLFGDGDPARRRHQPVEPCPGLGRLLIQPSQE